MPVLLYFGIWTESRIFDEFTLLVAVLATEAVMSYLKQWCSGWSAPAASLS
jgi:hypothetical protein